MLKPFTLRQNKQDSPKYCTTCNKVATQVAYFDVGRGVNAIERYCDSCAGTIKKIKQKGFDYR